MESALVMFVSVMENSFKWPDMAWYVGRKSFPGM